jgi:galactokinase
VTEASRFDRLAASLRATFGLGARDEVRLYRAPGRVNLIGEHTVYNDGFVMPAAIDRAVWMAAAPRPDRLVEVSSVAFPGQTSFSLDDRGPRVERHWSDYLRGVALALEEAGLRLQGASLLVESEVPTGSGLSSSAAIEVATGRALVELSGLELPPLDLARICQRAENVYCGTRCGIMDQFASCCGQAGQALLLDCRSLDYEPLPLPTSVKLCVCNTMVKHELASGEYNLRRAECEAGVKALAGRHHGLRSLRDATLEELEAERRAGLDPVVARRCRHVLTENARVLEARAALLGGDLPRLGALMAESHRSLRDDYQVSCRELDIMVDLAGGAPGLRGARMTGGGFGGCTINLVDASQVEAFCQVMLEGYERATGRRSEPLICEAAGGAECLR